MSKKIISILLSLLLIFSGSMAAFAENSNAIYGATPVVTGDAAAAGAAKLSADAEELADGSYYVPAGESLQISSEYGLTVNGTVNLTLEEGSSLIKADSDEVSSFIEVPAGSVLNIYGADSSKISGCILVMGGELNMYSGTISSGEGNYCVDVEESGAFNLYGGNLLDSCTGVVVSDSNLTAYGGNINGNEIGVSIWGGKLELLGGLISGNDTGVNITSAEIVLGGSIKIENNTEANLDIGMGEAIAISSDVPVTADMHVGLGMGMFAPESGEEYVLDGLSDQYADNFSSDDEGCYIKAEDGQLKIVSRIVTQASDWEFKFEISSDGLEDKTIEYTWYEFNKTEVANDESLISEGSTGSRYANSARAYNAESGKWTIENPINDEAYYEDPDNAADYILHVPANTYITLHGVLNGIGNQYEIGLKGEDIASAYDSYDNMSVDLGAYTQLGGDVNLYTYYYSDYGVDESEETDENATPVMAISHITYYTLGDAVATGSELDTKNLEDGYYICKAVVKDGSKVVETYESDIVYNGSKPYYDDEDTDALGGSSSSSVLPVFIGLGSAIIIAVVVILAAKKKKQVKTSEVSAEENSEQQTLQ